MQGLVNQLFLSNQLTEERLGGAPMIDLELMTLSNNMRLNSVNLMLKT